MKLILMLTVATAIGQAGELPVRQVILYKHGIGYFERSGKLAPGESARLDFKAQEMNDVLKSLTIQERGGGRVSGLRYDSADPLGHKLEEFPFKLGDGQALSAVLDQLKGARLELQIGNQPVAGAIVNGRLVPGDDKRPEREQVTLLLDSGELRPIDLNAATSIRFTDPRLQQQFRDYLSALTASRSQDKRSVYIDSTDDKERDLVASYTIPAAVWKSSYRLIFGAAAKPSLEGWAIVDNTTGEDWTKVTLALVSGRPISFISQLYPPRYVNRPTAELPEDQAYGPVIHEGAYAAALAAPPSAGLAGVGGGYPGSTPAPSQAAPAAVARKSMARPGVQRLEQFGTLQSTVAADTVSQAVGDLFEYRLSQPVTIRKSESAMLPFLQQPLDARKLLIYSAQGGQHPTNAAELTNSSGKTLDGGPITVYDGGNYAGEALMETLKSGDKRLISYAVDLGTRVTEAFGTKDAVVREVHANRGVLATRTASEETRTYTIRNVDQKAKTLIVEHPLRPGFTLLNQKPAEKTSSAYRFEVKLAPGAESSFAVSEERVWTESYQVSNLAPDVLLVYISNKTISESGRKQLEQIANRKTLIAETHQQSEDVKAQIAAAETDEERLRKNIGSLNQVSGQQQLVQEYARKLAALEIELAGLRDREAQLQKKATALEAELGRMIQALTF